MDSFNFEFIRPQWPELASLGGFAETYAYPDPTGSLNKLRSFCEHSVKWLHHHLRLTRIPKPNLIDLLNDSSFRSAVPDVIISKMHTLRIEGNKATHQEVGDTTTALRLLKDAYDLARWLHLTYGQGKIDDCPEFVEPPSGGVTGYKQRKEKKAILDRVAAQDAQLKQLLEELDETRLKAQQAEVTAEELKQQQQAGQESVAVLQKLNPLDFDEAETRRHLIDVMLTEAGWDVGPGLKNTDEVVKEFEVQHQPTQSGTGFADYVLFDESGKPVAVVEAKKASEEVQKGKNQARMYADGIEKTHGFRPVIFYTNGHELWIWNDADGEPPRKIYGFYSKDSLQHLIFQRTEKHPLSAVKPNPEIAGRMYQIEAVRQVVEKFAEKKRKALIVLATGTGKTRVAISLCDAMIRASWAKRILFLCDRKELRKQAHNAFKEFLPSEPRTYVTGNKTEDDKNRIFFATYPKMMECFHQFDIGFFDLIIADESHRSLYNRYRHIFEYFDAYNVGLTATPVEFVTRNTFAMFECDEQDPTANYTYEEAINNNPQHLVPFVVNKHTTSFLRDGIKYSQMTAKQREQLEDDDENPEAIEYELGQVDKQIFNKDTNRVILQNLMENGIKVSEGSQVGKSIIFARNHNHAVLIAKLFDEMYPQYGGKFCQVIDNYDPRAEELIDEFKQNDGSKELTIAVSVDMLDTGIDIPEVVNLVFAKPVYSHVKFWQMIGRGTRLCQNLFGPGQDKTHFQIFDHWGNFERFDEGYQQAEPKPSKSLLQRVFEARLTLAQDAIDQQSTDAFELATELIRADLNELPKDSLPVREKWEAVQKVNQDGSVEQFDAATKGVLEYEIAPLMQWIKINGYEEAHKFDRLIAQLQSALIKGSSKFEDLQATLLEQIGHLPINLSQVKHKMPFINKVKSPEFWDQISVRDLEEVRTELRGLMKLQQKELPPKLTPKVIDVKEERDLIEIKRHKVKLEGLEMVAYRNRVQKVLLDIIENNTTLQKIKSGQSVQEQELETLCSLILSQQPDLDLHDLVEYYPESAGHLDQAIRSIIGVEASVVEERFTRFVQQHPNLASHQIQFLNLLKNHINKYGSIKTDRLYEPPFTNQHTDGIDGLFPERLANDLFKVIESFNPPAGDSEIVPENN